MAARYSIAEARDNFARVVREAEAGRAVEVTRRGRPVAVIVSLEDYRRSARPGFSEAVRRWRETTGWGEEAGDEQLDVDALFGARDRDPGREVRW